MTGRQTPALPGPGERVYGVAELNKEVRLALERNYPLIWIEGEISNFRHFQASGHWYFTLKDSAAQVSAAMFRGQNRHIPFTPADGMQVLVLGQVSLYEARGSYQVIVRRMAEQGAGALHAAFQRLRERLAAEGLFHESRKRPLPTLPQRIGIVTSRDGAALRDILRILHRRHAGVSVLLIPTRVQGEGAASEIAAAISRAGAVADLDVLIVGRGGGSLEDLWAFNEEEVARALAACPIPVISAVGHETDVTIADMVADHRAATPSAAATMVVAPAEDMRDRVHGLGRRLAGATRLTLSRLRSGPAGSFHILATRLLEGRLQRYVQRTDDFSGRLVRAGSEQLSRRRQRILLLTTRLSPRSLMAGVTQRRQRLTGLRRHFAAMARLQVDRYRQRLALAGGRLQELSPLAVLGRGYAMVRDPASGSLLRDTSGVSPGDELEVRLHRGEMRVRVHQVNNDDRQT
ncbi:MAG: exodeoxyribonuclease VII large subunit [Acidobacteria bacterium]|nr:exodeoxyribonuclease VII large subunit [Acidobacteriota bacterium]MCZ6833390.1 exodeoxyribonuclease VII large subunit [Acidobacteriota bacterium]